MKKIHYLPAAALTLLLVILVVSCELLPVSIEGRLDLFISDLNLSDRSNVYLNFAEGYTTDYGTIKPHAFWEADFPVASQNFSYSALDTGDSANVTFTLTGSIAYQVYVKVKMRKIGTKWFIEDLYTRALLTDPWDEIVS